MERLIVKAGRLHIGHADPKVAFPHGHCAMDKVHPMDSHVGLTVGIGRRTIASYLGGVHGPPMNCDVSPIVYACARWRHQHTSEFMRFGMLGPFHKPGLEMFDSWTRLHPETRLAVQ
jgi:hypothetical protein